MRRSQDWRTWQYRYVRGWGGGRRGDVPVGALVLAGVVVLLGILLLHGIWVIFQHAYLNSYLYVPGARVTSAYWAAIWFAVRSTVLLVALVAAVVTLVAVALGRARRR